MWRSERAFIDTVDDDEEHNTLFQALKFHLGKFGIRFDGQQLWKDEVGALQVYSNLTWAQWSHEWRALVRRVLITAAAVRRPREFGHLQGELVSDISVQWWRRGPVKAEGTYLKKLLSGGFLTAARHWRHSKGSASPYCWHCREIESLEHVLLHCTAYNRERLHELTGAHPGLDQRALLRTLVPESTVQHMEKDEKEALARRLESWQRQAVDIFQKRDQMHVSTPVPDVVPRRLNGKQRAPPWAQVQQQAAALGFTRPAVPPEFVDKIKAEEFTLNHSSERKMQLSGGFRN